MKIFLNIDPKIPHINAAGVDVGPCFTGLVDLSPQQDGKHEVFVYFRPGTSSVALHQATKAGPSESKVRTYDMYEGDGVYLCNTKVSQIAFFPHTNKKGKAFYSVDVSELRENAVEKPAIPVPPSLTV